MTFELKDYRFVKSHRIETSYHIHYAFLMNARILQPVFDAISVHTMANSADVACAIAFIQEIIRTLDNTNFIGGRFVDAIGVREDGVDMLIESDLMENRLCNDYHGGIFVLRVEYDTEHKITYLILDEYERREESGRAED